MEVTFWGCRGSVPVSGAQFIRYGGATTCIEVSVPSTTGPQTVILDCGSGLPALGRAWGARRPDAVILQTHMHWDHIQGFPFFAPLFRPDATFTMVAAPRDAMGLEAVLAAQMARPTFPVGLDIIPARLEFVEVPEAGALRFGELEVRWCPVQHPGGCTAWRLDHQGTSVVFTGDLECEGQVPAGLVTLARGADLLIMDAQYLPEEIASRRGFGHSTPAEAAAVACAGGVGHLVLTHHDPSHCDATIDSKVALARATLHVPVDAAHEGLTLRLAMSGARDELFEARP